MERIPFQIINTELRTIKESKDGYLELHDDYLFCFVSYISHEPPNEDEPEIKKDVEYFNYVVMDREKIDCIDFYLAFKNKKICLNVYCGNSSFSIFFEDWKVARSVMFKIKNWKYKTGITEHEYTKIT